MLLTKVDLLPHLPEIRLERLIDNLERVNPAPRAIPFSSRSGEGLEAWLAWLEARRPARTASAAPSAGRSEHHHVHGS